MRKKPSTRAEKYRYCHHPNVPSTSEDGNNGYFAFKEGGFSLAIMVSDGEGWDHVSVSALGRCPTWEEMELVRDIFFYADETVIQYSVPRSAHINCHPYCLHLWRNQNHEAELPPSWMVGPTKEGTRG